MISTPATLRTVRAVLFDMDGVIYVGKQPLPGVRELLCLPGRHRPAVDVCHQQRRHDLGSSSPPSWLAMGFDVPPERILGSSEATAQWLRTQIVQHGWPDGKVIVLGMEGLRAALRGHGLRADYRLLAPRPTPSPASTRS